MINLKIDNTVPVQKNFLGNGAVYHGYAGMPDSDGRVYSEELSVLEAKRAADMKLKIARTFYSWWAWEPETKKWNWDNEIMKAFYCWLQRMKDANITVALNAAWLSPNDIDGTGWNKNSPFPVKNDWGASVQNYADWVSETLHQLIELRGFTNIKILVMFTEPTNNGLDRQKSYELWADAVIAVNKTLLRDGRRELVNLMGPNEGSTTTSEMVKWVSESDEIKDVLDIYSSHTYQHFANIPRKYIKTGKTSVSMSIAGARISQVIKLKPNTDYTLFVDLLFYKTKTIIPMQGNIFFGLYIDDGRNDIHKIEGSGPALSACVGSTSSISTTDLTDTFKRYEITFNSGEVTSGVIGVFHDIKTPGSTVVDQIVLQETNNDVSIVSNGNFENDYNDWKLFFAGGTKDAYFDWYSWTKTGLKYAKDRPFCFDEYGAVYNRDNSRLEHGADIVTAAVAMMNAGVQSSLLWTLFDQQWPNNHTTNLDSFFDGDHRCGVASTLTRSLVPHLSYYAFSLLSRYVDGEGTKVYEGFGENCLHTTMAVSSKGDITIVVVNNKDVDENYKISFKKTINATFYRHCFNPNNCIPDENATIIGIDRIFNNIDDNIIDDIAPYSVIVYTTHLD